MPKAPGVSLSVIKRLPRYYRFLSELLSRGVERISSRELADIMSLTASQIRQDLNCFGGFGQQGYGYTTQALHSEIGRILGLDRRSTAILIGAGNLGRAIIKHMDFNALGFDIAAIFDSSETVAGMILRGITVQHTANLHSFCTANHPTAAVLCIPNEHAGELAQQLVELGIKGFWNFTHFDLSAAFPGIAVENVHLGDSLMTLSYQLNQLSTDPEDPL